MTTLLAEPDPPTWQERAEELMSLIDSVTAAMVDEHGLMLLSGDPTGYNKLQAQYKEATTELGRIWAEHPPEAVLP